MNQQDLERLSDTIDAMSSGVIVWDQDQRLFFANEAAKKVRRNLVTIWSKAAPGMICLRIQ